MKIILNKSCDEIKELLEVYSSLQQRVKQHVNKISECIACAKNGKINTDSKGNIYLENHTDDSEVAETK